MTSPRLTVGNQLNITRIYRYLTSNYSLHALSLKSKLPVLQKGKSVPLQAWSGPEGSRKLRFPDFMTTAQDGGNFVSLTPLTPGNAPGIHFC